MMQEKTSGNCTTGVTTNNDPHRKSTPGRYSSLHRLNTANGIGVNLQEQETSSDIEQQMTANEAIHSLKIWRLQHQRKHNKSLTKYEAVHPTAVSENNSSSGMLII